MNNSKANPYAVSLDPPDLIVLDDVYLDPERVRDYAMRMTYSPPTGTYPGRNATERVLAPELIGLFSKLIGYPIHIRDDEAFGVFRMSRHGETGNFIHADPSRWGAVIYLNDEVHEHCGTAFWRHRRLGLEAHPWLSWKAYGFSSVEDAWQQLVQRDGQVDARWDLLLTVPSKFNRLLLFNPRSYHSHIPRDNFGNTPSTARLVQVFFFHHAPA